MNKKEQKAKSAREGTRNKDPLIPTLRNKMFGKYSVYTEDFVQTHPGLGLLPLVIVSSYLCQSC